MKTLYLKSPAKINLFLHITGKREHGYHNLQTVFRLIDFYDDMWFEMIEEKLIAPLNTAPIKLITDNTITQNSNDNLVIKAGQTLYNFAKQNILSPEQLANLPLIEITLQKNIPTGAGLGGGSSNCATTLMALNTLWKINLSNKQLQAIGARLGADVPIFIFGQDAIAEGIGEILTPINLPPQRFLLLTPNAHINTAQLFAHSHLQRNCAVFSIESIEQNKPNFLDKLSNEFCNVFEPVVSELSDEVKTALDYLHALEQFTHSVARMSGSGSSVFLPIIDNISLQQLQNWQNNAPCPAFIVNTLSSGFLQNALNS